MPRGRLILAAASGCANRLSFSFVQGISKPDLPHVTIAVVGGEKAGKTTFITSALDMRHPASSRTTTKKMSLDGSVYLVRLLEISSKEIVRDSQGPLWPRFGSDPSPPKVDGALVLHDTTQPAICSEIANLLGMSTMSIPEQCHGQALAWLPLKHTVFPSFFARNWQNQQ